MGTAVLDFLSGQYGFGSCIAGETALAAATAKASLPTVQLFLLAVLRNVLVCFAIRLLICINVFCELRCTCCSNHNI